VHVACALFAAPASGGHYTVYLCTRVRAYDTLHDPPPAVGVPAAAFTAARMTSLTANARKEIR
jgi:hypothetical protein